MDLRTKILGQDASMPYFITSCAGQRMFHADGEVRPRAHLLDLAAISQRFC